MNTKVVSTTASLLLLFLMGDTNLAGGLCGWGTILGLACNASVHMNTVPTSVGMIHVNTHPALVGATDPHFDMGKSKEIQRILAVSPCCLKGGKTPKTRTALTSRKEECLLQVLLGVLPKC